MENKVAPVDEMLPKGQLFTYGLQHVMAMYAGAVAVPLIIANALNLPREQVIYLIQCDLLVGGIATLIQALGFLNMGIKSPIMQGVSFAAVAPMILVGQTHGLPGIFGGTIAAGLIGYLISPFFSRLIRFFPRVVTGTIITLIGVSLLPVAVRWAGGGNAAAPTFGDLPNIGLAFTVLAIVIVLYRMLKGFWSNIAVLLGLVIGTIIAIPLGMTNFAQVSTASWFQLVTPLAFGMPIFDITAIVAMTLAFLVIMTETTGDIIAVGEIVDKPVTRDDLTRGLRADSFSTLLGGIMNTFPHSAFAQNVGLLALTGIRSRYVVAAAGIILAALGLFPKAAAIVAAIPNPVLGGAGIAMFGMVATSGIRTLAKVKFEGNHNAMIVAISLGVGLIPLAAPTFYHKLPQFAQLILHSGITAGSIAAIALNLFFNELGTKTADAEPVDSETEFSNDHS
ncbi:nucleobase:cation symporter-2 family protein [Sporomusa sphaeroides]|uniref:Uric acid transporter UacT n=1 Tax=Sporomusa sphaeroides DSM 2875 TaxID=1337886 RepID=A0ABP2C9A4_9FIRM|nr:nucleobase:cation symporter-2 family protein [Sporomusa sphaeroides]OLS55295.1 uric acid transporter UacT [Sporomusa sphaeroides DSM 2875]CVK20306.1 Uric acid transporter UacT [Sporomusa sphaeroides DSM 2875]